MFQGVWYYRFQIIALQGGLRLAFLEFICMYCTNEHELVHSDSQSVMCPLQ
jgi:hypothetical protein